MNDLFLSFWNATPWWALGLTIVYVIYFVCRTWYIFGETSDDGVLAGLKTVYIEHRQTHLRLYHVIWTVIDIPCIIVGSLLPFIKLLFTLKIAPLRTEERK